MNKFEAHIKASKTIELKRPNGEVDKFTLSALPYKFMPDIFELFNKIKDLDSTNDENVMDVFDKETVTLIQKIIIETLKISYPDEKIEYLEGFASSHLLDLLPIIIELNSFNVSDVKK